MLNGKAIAIRYIDLGVLFHTGMTENQELIFTQDTQKSFDSQTIDRRAFLKLPVEQRNALLAQQAATITEYFCSGVEGMEWTDEYVT